MEITNTVKVIMNLDELKLQLDILLTDIKYNGSYALGKGIGSIAAVEGIKKAAKKNIRRDR